MKIQVKRYKGKIITKGRSILDQLNDKPNVWIWSGGGSFTKHIKSKYDLTPQEYYNLVVYGDKLYKPKCLTCGKPVEFIKLSKGYRTYCSTHCVSSADITEMNRFLSYGYKIAYLYICAVNDNCMIKKFGITGCLEYNTRQNYRGHYLSDHVYILKGNPKILVQIEKDVDHIFGIDNTEFVRTSDIFEIMEFVKSEYEKRSTTISIKESTPK